VHTVSLQSWANPIENPQDGLNACPFAHGSLPQ
jgi:hypothetical protein